MRDEDRTKEQLINELRELRERVAGLEKEKTEPNRAGEASRKDERPLDDITERKRAEDALRQSEERLEFVLKGSQLGFWDWNLDTNEVMRNERWAEMLGYRLRDIDFTVKQWHEFIHPDDRSMADQSIRDHLEGRTPMHKLEYRMLAKDGQYRWILDQAQVVKRDSQGRPIRMSGTHTDITDRKRIEEVQGFLLQCGLPSTGEDFFESLARYLAEKLGMNFVCIDRLEGDGLSAQTVAVYHDGRFEDNVAYTLQDTPCGDVVGKTICCFPRKVRHLFPRDAVLGDLMAESYAGTTLFDSKGKPVGLIAVIGRYPLTDLHWPESLLNLVAPRAAAELERRQAEQALRESEEAHRALVAGLPDIVMRFDRDGRHLFMSDNVEEFVDLKAARFIGKTHRELGFPEAQCRFWEDEISAVFESGAVREPDFQFIGKRGRSIFNCRLLPERDARGTTISVLSLCRDITAHRKAEQDYQTLFREMLDGFALHEIVLDPRGQPADYRFLAANPAFERLTGLKVNDLIGKTVLEVLPGTERHWIETYGRVALTGEPVFFENYAAELNRHFEVTVFRPAPNQFACIFTDITKRKRAEEEREKLESRLQQAQKLEAIGTLAGGIAHDFNNILSAVLGYTEMALTDLPEHASARMDMKQVLTAAHRAKDLVKQILVFSRQGETCARHAIAVAPIVKEVLKLLRATLPATIEFWQDVAEDSGTVMGDPTQFHQVLVNLCTNAAHAMRESGGILEVTLGRIELDALTAEEYENLRPGSFVKLTVRDTGHGMDSTTLARIFDPYFTTKAVGEGSGLGLAVIQGIVKRHEGAVFVRSEPGKGTIFEILLPRIEAGRQHTVEEREPLAGGTERILFVDDEEPLVTLGKRMLVRLGYHVTTSMSSLEAIELFRSEPDGFDLVITDYTMPHMTGVDLAGEMLRIRPDIPILLSTGYSEMISEDTAKEIGIRAYVMKPLSLRDIAGLIRTVLDEIKAR